MSQFVRTDYVVRITAKNEDGPVIYPQAVVVNYAINTVPTARVDLAFGRAFGEADESELTETIEQLNKWTDDRELLVISVSRKQTETGSAAEVTKDERIFEGRIIVPPIQITRAMASYTLQLQHWTADLSIGSMLISYALPGHPDQRRADALYKRNFSGAQFAGDQPSAAEMEGVAYRLGLPADWKQSMTLDIWANGQKSIFAALAQKNFVSPMAQLHRQCQESINRPSQYALDALERIQGPSPSLGSDYTTGQPLAISNRIPLRTRNLLGENIAKAIGYSSVALYRSMTFWDKLLAFCAEFGVVLVPRPHDAVLIPLNVGMRDIYEVEVDEDEEYEVGWAAMQQTGVRGVGIVSTYTPRSGASGLGIVSDNLLTHGCYLGSDDPNRGMVYFAQPPRWLANIPPDSVTGEVARAKRKAFGVHVAPEDQIVRSELAVADDNLQEDAQTLFAEYAKLRYLETNLANRSIRLATHYRTDIAPGSMVKVNLRQDRMVSRLNLNTPNLVGLVSSMSIVVSRIHRNAVASMQLDYTRTEDQVASDENSLDNHPIFDSQVSGMPLVDE